MVFEFRSVTKRIRSQAIVINKVSDLIKLIDKYKCGLIIRETEPWIKKEKKTYTIIVYDDYIE